MVNVCRSSQKNCSAAVLHFRKIKETEARWREKSFVKVHKPSRQTMRLQQPRISTSTKPEPKEKPKPKQKPEPSQNFPKAKQRRRQRNARSECIKNIFPKLLLTMSRIMIIAMTIANADDDVVGHDYMQCGISTVGQRTFNCRNCNNCSSNCKMEKQKAQREKPAGERRKERKFPATSGFVPPSSISVYIIRGFPAFSSPLATFVSPLARL